MPHMRHIVDAVQILYAIRIIQAAALPPDNMQGLAIVQSGAGPYVGPPFGQHLLEWQVMLLQGCSFRLDPLSAIKEAGSCKQDWEVCLTRPAT